MLVFKVLKQNFGSVVVLGIKVAAVGVLKDILSATSPHEVQVYRAGYGTSSVPRRIPIVLVIMCQHRCSLTCVDSIRQTLLLSMYILYFLSLNEVRLTMRRVTGHAPVLRGSLNCSCGCVVQNLRLVASLVYLGLVGLVELLHYIRLVKDVVSLGTVVDYLWFEHQATVGHLSARLEVLFLRDLTFSKLGHAELGLRGLAL